MAKYTIVFWGTVYDQAGIRVENAARQFWNEDSESWDHISGCIRKHASKFIRKENFQSGFGGNYSDGCIEYSTWEKVDTIPLMKFQTNEKLYTMTFSTKTDL
jgi:hypothetical protein